MGTIDRFWRKVQKTDGCWLWQGAKSRDGYGNAFFRERTWLAHRLSWTWANGEIPDGLNVLHRCDTPACVKPEHLFLGTQADNVADALKKGRWLPRPATAETRRKMSLAKMGNTIKRDWINKQRAIAS